MTRCKFKCDSKTQYANGASVKLSPVTSGSPENEQFYKWTPSGTFEIGTINDDAAAQFIPGKSYFIDISIAE